MTDALNPPMQLSPSVPPEEQAIMKKKKDEQYLSEITKDFQRLQQQKCRPSGGVEPRVLLNLAFGANEHYTVIQNKQILAQPIEANKLSLVFNLIDGRVNKLIGRLCSIEGVFKANPEKRDPKAFSEAEVVDRLIKALDQKLDQPSRMREIMFWLMYGGTAFEYIPWVRNCAYEPVPQYSNGDPTNPQGELLFIDLLASQGQSEKSIVTESQMEAQLQQGRPQETFQIYEEVGEVGEVGSEIYGPLNVFIDQGTKSIKDLPPDGAIYIAFTRTWGYLEENYPGCTKDLTPDDDIQIVTTRFEQPEGVSVSGVSLKDIIPIVQGSRTQDDPPMNIVIERYQPSSKQYPRGKFTCFIPNKKILFDGDNPYEEIPVVDYHFKPTTTTFWSKDYVTDLISPQRFINRRMSQMGEQANASIYDKLLLAPGLTEKDIPSDYPGIVKGGLNDQGQPQVARLPGPSLPGWFMESINHATKIFNDIAGGTDLFQEHQFPGQLRGPMAVPMLQEILDTEWGPFYKHLGERLARAKQMRLNRVKKFYPPSRTMHYMDRTQKDEVFEFHTDEILRAGTNFNITVEQGSLLPELRALREARIRERLASPLSILYVDDRTGRIDKSKVAADLQFGDTGRDGEEAQSRKLGAEIVGMLWRGERVPPVLPFYNHAAMMDELEGAMRTLEFAKASEPIQQLFYQRWQQHQQYLQQAADAAQRASHQSQIDGAVAQGVQAASAEAAAFTVKASLPALRGQVEAASGVPTLLHQTFNQGKDPA